MALIEDGGVNGVTLRAQLSEGGSEWPPTLETWPVHLGWGVTLEAPDIYFNAPPSDGGPTIFVIFAYSSRDQDVVTIEGDPISAGHFIHVGVPTMDEPPTSSTSVALQTPGYDSTSGAENIGVPVVLSNLWAHSSLATLFLNDGASVQFGPLPVHLGSNQFVRNLTATTDGVTCLGTAEATPRLYDVGTGALQIDDANVGIEATGCDISLIHGPQIGAPPQAIFDGGCSPNDLTAVAATDDTSIRLGSIEEPADFICQQFHSIRLNGYQSGATDPAGTPSIDFVGTFEDQGCFAIFGPQWHDLSHLHSDQKQRGRGLARRRCFSELGVANDRKLPARRPQNL